MAGAEPLDTPEAWSIAGSWQRGATATPDAAAITAIPADPASDADRDLDPGPDDPLKAAMQYRRLLGASDAARARADRDAYQRRQGGRAQARRHREA
ncbi:hypothetical protein ND748_33030, partial [Frankia sp. AiPs1]|nr:hypothetical protein [Frankia sp. AiPs1]